MLARGAQTNAKEDTRILLLTSLSADLSQYGTNLTASAPGAYELNSARCSLALTREVYARCSFSAAEADAIVVAHHNAGLSSFSFALGTNGAGRLNAVINGGTAIWTAAAVVPAADLSISWSTRTNPDTTGASDAMVSEIVVYSHTTGEWLTNEQVTHAVAATATTHTLSVGGVWDGAAIVSGPATAPTKIRVSSSFHSSVEVAEDWIAARTAYAGDLDDQIDEPLGPTVASGLGSSPQIVGRAQVGYAAAHARATQRRGWSSLVNEAYLDPVTFSNSAVNGRWPDHWRRDAPGSSYAMPLPFLRWVALPPGSTHAFVRVHVRSWVTSGAAVPLGIRCYAMNRPPDTTQIGAAPAPTLEYAYRGAVLTADHGSGGTGEWLDLGLVRLPRFTGPAKGWTETTHLCLAYAWDPAAASANDANARAQILAWHVRPVQVWTPGGLFGG